MRSIFFIIFSFISFPFLFAQDTFPDFPPKEVTASMDRNQMLWQMGIQLPNLPLKTEDPNAPLNAWPSDSLNPEGNWTDKIGHFIARSSWGLWNNYDDVSKGFFPGVDTAKLGGYELLDLLKMNDGTPITSQEEWWEKRRPEIKEDAMAALYGYFPADSVLPAVKFSVVASTGGNDRSAYIQKVLIGHVDVSRYPEVRDKPVVSGILRIPAEATGQVPVMIVFGGFGNQLERYWETMSAQGWGVCYFEPNALQPDNGVGLTSYLIGLVNKGNWRKPGDWGSIGAWSWGISRLVDYLESDPLVNAKAVGLTGHSRYGKATLYAMAMDERIFIGFPSDAGSLGTAVNRRHWGQDLEHSTWDSEYHWMAGNFFQWAGEKIPGQYLPRKIDDCPVDSYSLLAVCAPRPALLNGGNHSGWTDPYGQYLTTEYATPVYEFLGVKGMVMNDGTPILDKAYIEGNLAYRYHDGGHTDQPEWPAFFEFASKFIKVNTLSTVQTALVVKSEPEEAVVLNIESKGKWTISETPKWIMPDKKSGEGHDKITFQVKGNKKSEGRSFELELIGEGRKMKVTISQASMSPQLQIPSDQLIIMESEGQFDIKSNTAWRIESSDPWLSVINASGANDKAIKLKAAENPKVEKRTAQLTITAFGLEPRMISVTQNEGKPSIRLSTTSLIVGGQEGSEAGFWAFSNTTWMVTSSADWLLLSSGSGLEGFQRMSVKASENYSGKSRTAQVTILIKDMEPLVINVTQDSR